MRRLEFSKDFMEELDSSSFHCASIYTEKVGGCKSAIPVVGMTRIGGDTREKGALTP